MARGETVKTLELDPAIEAVEMKITARAENEDQVVRVLEREGVEPELRRVYFYDTSDLALFGSGVVLRARLVRDGADDSTVKLRPVEPSDIDDAWKQVDGFEIEVDAVDDDLVCSAKLSVDQDRGEIEAVAAGKRKVRALFSGDQERLLEAHAPAGVGWDDLIVYGPVAVRKWEFEPKDLGHELTVEEWTLPDGSDLVELSIKVPPMEALTADRDFKRYLADHHFDIDDEQRTKTRSALEFFRAGPGTGG